MRKTYSTPQLTVYGRIVDHTFTVGNGKNVKGGGECWHYDSFMEQSGIECTAGS